MARRARPPLAELEASLGHVFSDPDLLTRALTHVSGAPAQRRAQSNQRLEFLGDRVLGLAVAELLFERFPDADEGELSRRLADLVRKETCADVSRVWGVGPHLRLGASEAMSSGREKTAILGDACEAIIGAVFRDAGYDAARALVRRGFADRMAAPSGDRRDAKTRLQEWAQARGLKPPTYLLLARSGPDHAPSFRIGVAVEGFAQLEAEGASKRAAEQTAAAGFLEREGVAEPVAPLAVEQDA